jgi:30S ribosomal protein 3
MDRFVLKFLWLEKTIAVALDQKIGEKTVPLTEFYFWPQKDAWEEMKLFLEKKSWISQADVITILNQVTEVINYWQDKDNLSKKELAKIRSKFADSLFVGYE